MNARKPALASALSAALLAAALAGTSPASAQPTAQQPNYNVLFTTQLVDVDHFTAGESDGTLSLTFGNGGTIQGYYHPVDTSAYIPLTGGLDGDKIYLDIPGFPPINGTYKDGKIVGYTFIHELTHRFTAVRSNYPST